MNSAPTPAPDASGGLRSGLAWTSLATGLDYALNLLRIIIVARILTPTEFGLFSMCMTIMLGIKALGEFGFKDAFIAHEYGDQGEKQRWLHSIWSTNLAIQTGLAALVALLAWPSAALYGEPSIIPMVLALAVVPLCNALNNPALMMLEKQLRFVRLASFEVSEAAVALISTVVLAWLTESAWSLVLGQIIAAVFGTVMSYCVAPHRPAVRFDREPIIKSLHYGKYLMVVAVMTIITMQFDKMWIGAQLGAAALGFYAIAHRIATVPALMLGASVARTLFPYYARTARDDRPALGAVWLESFGLVAWLSLAAYLPLIFFADFYIVALFGEQWDDATHLLEVLAVVGLLRAFGRGTNPLQKAVRRTDLDAKAKVLESAIFLPAVVVGVALTESAVGAAWGGMLAYAIGIVARLVPCLRMTGLGMGAFLLRFARPCAGGLALALGASAVGIGRPVLWGLAVDGADGVAAVLDLLVDEFDHVLRLAGVT